MSICVCHRVPVKVGRRWGVGPLLHHVDPRAPTWIVSLVCKCFYSLSHLDRLFFLPSLLPLSLLRQYLM